MNTSLARRALRGALEVRKKAQVPLSSPCCVYDVAADKLKIEVRFHPGTSFGGMYAKETRTILVPSERPSGRRAFTCAHEIGHWYFGHGTRLENLEEMEKGSSDDPDEILVNQFAGHFLMPKWAVEQALRERKLALATVTENDCYGLACQFGVGYSTIITHLRYALNLLSQDQAGRLLQSSPKILKERMLGRAFPSHLTLVDSAWQQDVPIDVEVGDGIFFKFKPQTENNRVRLEQVTGGFLMIAEKPGLYKLSSDESPWATFVRISRKGFTGRSIYRHLEDSDE